jgi:hypothetical protein
MTVLSVKLVSQHSPTFMKCFLTPSNRFPTFGEFTLEALR